MSERATVNILVVQDANPDLLHEQYRSLVKVAARLESVASHEERLHIEGLIEFLESIFEQNPFDFPMPEPSKQPGYFMVP